MSIRCFCWYNMREYCFNRVRIYTQTSANNSSNPLGVLKLVQANICKYFTAFLVYLLSICPKPYHPWDKCVQLVNSWLILLSNCLQKIFVQNLHKILSRIIKKSSKNYEKSTLSTHYFSPFCVCQYLIFYPHFYFHCTMWNTLCSFFIIHPSDRRISPKWEDICINIIMIVSDEYLFIHNYVLKEKPTSSMWTYSIEIVCFIKNKTSICEM